MPRFSAVSTPPEGRVSGDGTGNPPRSAMPFRLFDHGRDLHVCVAAQLAATAPPRGGRVRVRAGRGAWLPPDPLKISLSRTAVRDREEFAVRSPESSSNHERTTDITGFRGRVSVPGRVCPRKPRLTLPRAESLPDHETRTTGQRGAKAASPAPGAAIPPRAGSPPPAPPTPAPSRPEPATRRKLD